MGCGASSRTNTPVSNPKAPLHPDGDDSDGSEYGEHHEPMPAEDVQGVKDMPVTAAQDLSANTRQGYKWHAQIVGDDFFHKKHCTAPGFLKACRPFPHIKISDLRASLDKNEHGSWILSGPLNDWPGLVGLEFVSITCKVRSVMGTAVRRLWLHGSAEDTGPMEVLQALSDKTLRSLRGTFRAPTWTSVGWSPSSPGFLLWHASGYGGGLLHGSATVDFARSNKEAAEATATNVHFFTHRYAKATEGIKDRLIWHGAILIEWSHQRFVSVVELAWLNGLGGYHGRCNWCRDKLADPTAIYAGMPDSMKVPWQQHLAEIRMVDTEMKSFQEFEAFLHEFSGAGSLSIKEQRFFDPYVAFSGQVRLERRSLSDILGYLLNYSARNPHYEEARRNCQTFAADFFSMLTGQEGVQPTQAFCRVLYKPRVLDFLYNC
eukprot:CAMPEP_0181492032 /NCGR_PEP_ID=MMETSP1110-20121109/50459_1 /TAXON_ID=174948 /ORGANISM="Symbiodinium sp., Strain CCMP421" /LENGTH=431 /DNA_ID=CAMNT_0023619225 /DNA_START=14 /DNA_END=1309 /DNA_ORIENTATION=-